VYSEKQEEVIKKATDRILSLWDLQDYHLKTIDDMILMLGIYTNVVRLLNQDRARDWASKPNSSLNNKSAIDLIREGQIKLVDEYLKGFTW